MLKKKVNNKGLIKKILKLEYEKYFLSSNNKVKVSSLNSPSVIGNSKDSPVSQPSVEQSCNDSKFRILILRTEPITQRSCKLELVNPLDSANLLSGEHNLKEKLSCARVHSKCIKKSVLSTFDQLSKNTLVNDNWLKCKYIYWLTPDALSLKEQLLQLNMLKNYIRAEPRDAFLGCLIESTYSNGYKYYYPSQILSLCDSIEKLSVSPNKSTGLEILERLIQTLEYSISSLSTILALKTKVDSEEKGQSQS